MNDLPSGALSLTAIFISSFRQHITDDVNALIVKQERASSYKLLTFSSGMCFTECPMCGPGI